MEIPGPPNIFIFGNMIPYYFHFSIQAIFRKYYGNIIRLNFVN